MSALEKNRPQSKKKVKMLRLSPGAKIRRRRRLCWQIRDTKTNICHAVVSDKDAPQRKLLSPRFLPAPEGQKRQTRFFLFTPLGRLTDWPIMYYVTVIPRYAKKRKRLFPQKCNAPESIFRGFPCVRKYVRVCDRSKLIFPFLSCCLLLCLFFFKKNCYI